MGLDMYLYGVRYFSEYDDTNDLDKSEKHLVEEIYWRKANAIHNWFVLNVQEGTDNCASYYVSKEALERLMQICDKIIEEPSLAKLVLPTRGGFFFGPTEYDNYYMEEVKYTRNQLKRLLEEDNYDWYCYQSSW